MAIWRRENIHQHVNGTAPAVHLFHGIFAFEAAGQGEAIADGMDSQRPGLDNPKGGIGERKNTLGMHV